MKNHKIFVFATLTTMLVVFALAGCKKEDVSRIDGNSYEVEAIYTYAKNVKLTDESGQYYIRATVKANNEADIDQFIAMEPAIRVGIATSVKPEASTEELEMATNKTESPTGILFILSDDNNIPKGYFVEQYFKHQNSSNNISGRANQTYWFQDDAAKSVRTTVFSPYSMVWTYYSKGCCWYSVGYYNRGYITHNGTYSYHFFANLNYSPYTGVKCKTSTTPQGIANSTRTFYY